MALIAPLSEAEQIEKALCEVSLSDFMRVFWNCVEGTPFKTGWHLDAICEHLEAVSNTQIRRLMINGPPRSSKSMPASVFWPVWDWIAKPYRTWLTAGNTQKLANRFNQQSRQIIRNPKFQRYWGDIFQLSSDHDLKTEYSNDQGGKRLVVGVTTRFIGAGGELKVLDDPHMPTDSFEMMEDTCRWYFETWRTRTNNPMVACEVVVLQRLSTSDLGEMIKTHERELWDILVLPSRYTGKLYTTSLGFVDPRSSEEYRNSKKSATNVNGDLLWPEHVDDEGETILRNSLNRTGGKADAQLQQEPVNLEEVLYKPWTLNNFYDYIEYDRENDIVCTTTDTAVKSTEVADFTACGLGLKKGNRFFFLGGFAEKVEFGELVKLYNKLLSKWTKRGFKFYKHLIEDTSNGPALAALMQKKYPRIELIKAPSNRSKLSRLKSVIPVYEANRVFWPNKNAIIVIDDVEYALDDLQCLETWLDQTAKVPTGKDDCPDAWAQLINEIEDLSFLDVQDLYDDEDEDDEQRFFFPY